VEFFKRISSRDDQANDLANELIQFGLTEDGRARRRLARALRQQMDVCACTGALKL